MSRRLLDLFAGAGGCSVGYARAGFETVGVDHKTAPLRHYPYPHVRADALDIIDALDDGELDIFDAVHASPPCQFYSVTRARWAERDQVNLIPPTIEALTRWGQRTGRPWVIEGVVGSPLPGALMLCGSEFGLRTVDHDGSIVALRRHRLFASNIFLMGAGGCSCADDRAKGRIGGVYGGGTTDRRGQKARGGYTTRTLVAQKLMGLDVPWSYLTQAIPPAYTEHIGWQLLAHLDAAGTGA